MDVIRKGQFVFPKHMSAAPHKLMQRAKAAGFNVEFKRRVHAIVTIW